MHARIVKGKIIKYTKLPSAFGNTLVGFNKLSESEHEKYGFYTIITPSYNNKTEYLDNLHSKDNHECSDGKKRTVFIYDIKTKTFSETLEELKSKKIKKLKSAAYTKLESTDWYVTRKAEKGTAIPDAIEKERDDIRSSVNTKESEINALTKKINVFNYDIIL